METSVVGMEDYWNEFRTVRGRIAEMRRGSHSEEDSRSHDDDSDDAFLDAVLSTGLREDREISETELTNSKLYVTLTDRQKTQLIRRANERNLTLRQRRLKVKNPKPVIWSVFSGTDNSSTGTRSRSATPDSLDSLSPPHTPPDPSPKHWVDAHLSRSRASLDSGHHSLIMSSSSLSPASAASSVSPQQTEEGAAPHTPNQHATDHKREAPVTRRLARRVSPTEVSSRTHIYAPDEEQPTRIYRPSSLDMLANGDQNMMRSELPRPSKEVRRQRSSAKDLSKDVRHYYANKNHYELNPRYYNNGEISDIQGLHYKQIGSLHIPNYKKQNRKIPFEQIDHQQEPLKVYVSSSAPSNGVRRSQSIKHVPRDPFESTKNASERPLSKIKTSLTPFERVDATDEAGRRRSSADLGFRLLPQESEFPDVMLEVGRAGRTLISWASEADLRRLRALSLLELDILLSENGLHHRWRNRMKKRKIKEDCGVFGVPLETLNERDNAFLSDCFKESAVPQVLHKLITHLELRGLRDEGLLRIPGHRAKTEDLRKVLQGSFYSAPHAADEALRNASSNEIAALVKLFLRELPQPLLTHNLSMAFYKTHKIKNIGERISALTMLTILLPSVHRDTLRSILDLCGRIVAYEAENKMGLYNVAMIIAPNIFLPSLVHKSMFKTEDKEHQLNTEMEYARVTTQLVQVLIKYRDILWTIPNRLIAQIRHQYDSSLKSSNSKAIHKLLSKKAKELIHRPILNEVDFQSGVLRISAPQFNKVNYPVKLDWKMTAKDILARMIEEETASASESAHRVLGRREKNRPLLMMPIERASPPITTCLLRGSVSHALDNHAIHEKGGNIVNKRVDHNAYLIAVYQDNPNGEFLVQCHHPGGKVEDLNSQ